ncbi:hypothetical protein TRVL_07180 [Trypanosoma vivax]|nr:hypothetical protein TRVL_07180 [Trypanosoma vivax]
MRSLLRSIFFSGFANTLINNRAITPLPSLKQLRVGVLHVHNLPPHVFGEINPVSELMPQNGLQLQQLARLGVVAACFCCLQQDNGLRLMGITTMCCAHRSPLA